MQSSYTINNYGEIFKSIISAFNPVVCVELGVLEGYSAIAIAEGLKDNQIKHGVTGHLNAYDLFEDYPYRHSKMQVTQKNIDQSELSEWISLQKADAFEVYHRYDPWSVHFLHVDLSNDGWVIHRIMDLWDDRITVGGVICFEGGSEERDHVEWMEKYGKPSLKIEFENNPAIREKYVFGTYLRFPSMTCLLKKG